MAIAFPGHGDRYYAGTLHYADGSHYRKRAVIKIISCYFFRSLPRRCIGLFLFKFKFIIEPSSTPFRSCRDTRYRLYKGKPVDRSDGIGIGGLNGN